MARTFPNLTLLDASPRVVRRTPASGNAERRTPLIELEAVERRYGTGPNACIGIRGVTLNIAANDFVALAGPSGSGKSTLLNIVGGLDKPSAGTVRFGGVEVSTMKDAEICDFRLRHIGFVFQDARLVPVLSVAENIELPLMFRRDLTRVMRNERIAAVIEEVGLAGKERRRPGELSGGERQRAALARALAGEPAIILADEPTASLDQEAGASVIKLMRSLSRRRGTAVLFATHDPQLIMGADSVLRLRDGEIEEYLP